MFALRPEAREFTPSGVVLTVESTAEDSTTSLSQTATEYPTCMSDTIVLAMSPIKLASGDDRLNMNEDSKRNTLNDVSVLLSPVSVSATTSPNRHPPPKSDVSVFNQSAFEENTEAFGLNDPRSRLEDKTYYTTLNPDAPPFVPTVDPPFLYDNTGYCEQSTLGHPHVIPALIDGRPNASLIPPPATELVLPQPSTQNSKCPVALPGHPRGYSAAFGRSDNNVAPVSNKAFHGEPMMCVATPYTSPNVHFQYGVSVPSSTHPLIENHPYPYPQFCSIQTYASNPISGTTLRNVAPSCSAPAPIPSLQSTHDSTHTAIPNTLHNADTVVIPQHCSSPPYSVVASTTYAMEPSESLTSSADHHSVSCREPFAQDQEVHLPHLDMEQSLTSPTERVPLEETQSHVVLPPVVEEIKRPSIEHHPRFQNQPLENDPQCSASLVSHTSGSTSHSTPKRYGHKQNSPSIANEAVQHSAKSSKDASKRSAAVEECVPSSCYRIENVGVPQFKATASNLPHEQVEGKSSASSKNVVSNPESNVQQNAKPPKQYSASNTPKQHSASNTPQQTRRHTSASGTRQRGDLHRFSPPGFKSNGRNEKMGGSRSKKNTNGNQHGAGVSPSSHSKKGSVSTTISPNTTKTQLAPASKPSGDNTPVVSECTASQNAQEAVKKVNEVSKSNRGPSWAELVRQGAPRPPAQLSSPAPPQQQPLLDSTNSSFVSSPSRNVVNADMTPKNSAAHVRSTLPPSRNSYYANKKTVTRENDSAHDQQNALRKRQPSIGSKPRQPVMNVRGGETRNRYSYSNATGSNTHNRKGNDASNKTRQQKLSGPQYNSHPKSHSGSFKAGELRVDVIATAELEQESIGVPRGMPKIGDVQTVAYQPSIQPQRESLSQAQQVLPAQSHQQPLGHTQRQQPVSPSRQLPLVQAHTLPATQMHQHPVTQAHQQPVTQAHQQPVTQAHQQPVVQTHQQSVAQVHSQPPTQTHQQPLSQAHHQAVAHPHQQPLIQSQQQSFVQPRQHSFVQPQQHPFMQPQQQTFVQAQQQAFVQPQQQTFVQPQQQTFVQPQQQTFVQPQQQAFVQPQQQTFVQPQQQAFVQPQQQAFVQPQQQAFVQPQQQAFVQPQQQAFVQPQQQAFVQPQQQAFVQPQQQAFVQPQQQAFVQPQQQAFVQPQQQTFVQHQQQAFVQHQQQGLAQSHQLAPPQTKISQTQPVQEIRPGVTIAANVVNHSCSNEGQRISHDDTVTKPVSWASVAKRTIEAEAATLSNAQKTKNNTVRAGVTVSSHCSSSKRKVGNAPLKSVLAPFVSAQIEQESRERAIDVSVPKKDSTTSCSTVVETQESTAAYTAPGSAVTTVERGTFSLSQANIQGKKDDGGSVVHVSEEVEKGKGSNLVSSYGSVMEIKRSETFDYHPTTSDVRPRNMHKVTNDPAPIKVCTQDVSLDFTVNAKVVDTLEDPPCVDGVVYPDVTNMLLISENPATEFRALPQVEMIRAATIEQVSVTHMTTDAVPPCEDILVSNEVEAAETRKATVSAVSIDNLALPLKTESTGQVQHTEFTETILISSVVKETTMKSTCENSYRESLKESCDSLSNEERRRAMLAVQALRGIPPTPELGSPGVNVRGHHGASRTINSSVTEDMGISDIPTQNMDFVTGIGHANRPAVKEPSLLNTASLLLPNCVTSSSAILDTMENKSTEEFQLSSINQVDESRAMSDAFSRPGGKRGLHRSDNNTTNKRHSPYIDRNAIAENTEKCNDMLPPLTVSNKEQLCVGTPEHRSTTEATTNEEVKEEEESSCRTESSVRNENVTDDPDSCQKKVVLSAPPTRMYPVELLIRVLSIMEKTAGSYFSTTNIFPPYAYEPIAAVSEATSDGNRRYNTKPLANPKAEKINHQGTPFGNASSINETPLRKSPGATNATVEDVWRVPANTGVGHAFPQMMYRQSSTLTCPRLGVLPRNNVNLNRTASTGPEHPTSNPREESESWRISVVPHKPPENSRLALANKITDHGEIIHRNLRALLNKLTLEKFDTLYDKIKNVGMIDSEDVKRLMELICSKAKTQHHFIPMYVRLCVLLHQDIPTMSVRMDGEDEFRRLLVDACQTSFEETLHPIVAPENLNEEDAFEYVLLEKSKMKGNMIFVGELGKAKMIAGKVIYSCIACLLSNKGEPQLEALCVLLRAAGYYLDTGKMQAGFQEQMKTVMDLARDATISKRLRCLLQDVVDDYKNGWEKSKKEKNGPKKLSDLRKELEMESRQKTAACTRQYNNSSFTTPNGNGRQTRRDSDDDFQTVGTRRGQKGSSRLTPSSRDMIRPPNGSYYMQSSLNLRGPPSSMQSGRQSGTMRNTANMNNSMTNPSTSMSRGVVKRPHMTKDQSQKSGSGGPPVRNVAPLFDTNKDGRYIINNFDPTLSIPSQQTCLRQLSSIKLPETLNARDEDYSPTPTSSTIISFDIKEAKEKIEILASSLSVDGREAFETSLGSLHQFIKSHELSNDNLSCIIGTAISLIADARLVRQPVIAKWLLEWRRRDFISDVAFELGLKDFVKHRYDYLRCDTPNLHDIFETMLLGAAQDMGILSASYIQDLMNDIAKVERGDPVC